MGSHYLHSACRRCRWFREAKLARDDCCPLHSSGGIDPSRVSKRCNFSQGSTRGLAVLRDRAAAEPPGKCGFLEGNRASHWQLFSVKRRSQKCRPARGSAWGCPAFVSEPAAVFLVLKSRRTLGSAVPARQAAFVHYSYTARQALPFYKKTTWKEDCVDYWKLQSHVSGDI